MQKTFFTIKDVFNAVPKFTSGHLPFRKFNFKLKKSLTMGDTEVWEISL